MTAREIALVNVRELTALLERFTDTDNPATVERVRERLEEAKEVYEVVIQPMYPKSTDSVDNLL